MDLNFFSNQTLKNLSRKISPEELKELKELPWYQVEQSITASIVTRRLCQLYEKDQLQPKRLIRELKALSIDNPVNTVVDIYSIEVAETPLEFCQIW